MGQNSSGGRALPRSFTIVLAALLGVGFFATPASATVPNAPPQPTASAGVGQITVTFSAPVIVGTPVTLYTALCYPTTSGSAIVGHASNPGIVAPIVVAGLTNGAAYVCTVSATNAYGTGAPSIPSAVVVVGAPATVAQPVATAGHARITVAFNEPQSNGSPIRSYTASCTSSTGVPGSNTGAVSPIVITVLTNGAGYRCTVTATNALGTSAPSPSSALVTPFVSAPVAPAAPIVGRGDTKLSVTFIPPADDGGSAIIRYTASCVGSGAAGTNIGVASPITVTGLTNGATYTCTVTATNALGTSAPSPPSATVVPAPVPEAPAQPSVLAQTGSIVVTFTAPLDNGTPITSYSATCTSTNGGVPAAQSGATSPITVSGVSNAKTYTCTVAATSTTGTGASSPPSLAVIPTGIPAAPTLRAAGPRDGAAIVVFTPIRTSDAVITAFVAGCSSSNGGAAGLASGPTSPIIVPGLSNGKIYACAVQATNPVGASESSATSRAFIVGAPGTPTITHVVSGIVVGSTATLTVSFNPGPINGSAVSAYITTCTPLTTGATRVTSTITSPASVGGALDGHAYSCVVVAANARGTSAASAPVQVLVGTPAVPPISHVLLIRNGVVLTFGAPPANGRPILYYQGRCTSSDGGLPSSRVLQLVSPIAVLNLTGGRTYTCTLAAVNARGPGAPNTVGPFVVPAAQREPMAACHGNTGNLTATPGLQLSVAQKQTFTLTAPLSNCAGPYVQKATLSASMKSPTLSCSNAIGRAGDGNATLTWTAPGGLGTTTFSIHFTFASTAGHVTLAEFHGVVTSLSNIFSNAHIGGTVILNRGLGAARSGGDCPTSGSIRTFAVTSIALNIT